MELELGLKITHTRDDITSTSDLRITKDSSGPLFISRETDTMFFLIVHLKGFRRENIDIQINEGGNQIAISGKKPVQEMVLKGWIMQKKEVELRAFRKVFQIPDGVILDKIKAKFKEEESTLKIIMPKLVKGICGVEIEEVKEEEVDRGRPERESTWEIIKEVSKEPETKKMEEIDQVVDEEVVRRYPEITQAVDDKVPEKGNGKEEIVEPEIKNVEQTEQVVEQAVDQAQFEETEEVVQEESEEPNIGKMKETDRVLEEKVDRGEPKATENAADEVHKRVEEPEKKAKESEVKKVEETDQAVEKSQAIPKIESSRELEKAIPEKSEPPATTQSKEVEAKREVDQAHRKELLPSEETPSKELSNVDEHKIIKETPEAERKPEEGSNEHVRGPESIELEKTQQSQVPSPSLAQVEGKVPQELQQPESKKDVQEPTKPGTDQEPEKAVDEMHKIGNKEIEEKETVQEQHPKENGDGENESPRMQNQRQPSNGAAQSKEPVPKKSPKLCGPLVVAGSAILVSLIAIVIYFTRAKKR